MTEVYLMFYEASVQIFVTFNKFLQREDPIICVVLPQMKSFVVKLLAKYLKVDIIKAAGADITSIDYANDENQLPGDLNFFTMSNINSFQIIPCLSA